MEYGSSAETDSHIDDSHFTIVSRIVEEIFVPALMASPLAVLDLKILYVPIIMAPENAARYPARSRASHKKRVFDCSPQLDSAPFLQRDLVASGRVYLEGLRDCGKGLNRLGASRAQIEAFNALLDACHPRIAAALAPEEIDRRKAQNPAFPVIARPARPRGPNQQPMPDFLEQLGIAFPLFQAPMAGTSSPALAAAVSEAGGLGALGLGASNPAAAAKAIAELKALTSRPFHLNVFAHERAPADAARDAGWIARAAPLFEGYGATPPERLAEIYPGFRSNDDLLAIILEARPALVSFHFGLPRRDQALALKEAGILLAATATSLEEAQRVAGSCDAVIAQGWEAGGHRGIFDPEAPDERLSTEALTRRLVAKNLHVPIIAAGGLMDGADIARALSWGATAAQLGTAFIACPESAADPAHRARLLEGGTVMTAAISGRPARCLTNSFTAWAEGIPAEAIAGYPRAYDLGKALNAAAKAAGETGFGAQWAGMEAARARPMPATELMALLKAEFEAA